MKPFYKNTWYSKILITRLLAFLVLLSFTTNAQTVRITKNLHHVDVQHKGKTIRIQRNQNTHHKLTNSFAKTSRACPPFCITPFEISPNINVVGELELLNFLTKKVSHNKGLLIDSRLPDWYKKITIPGAINLPFLIFNQTTDTPIREKLLSSLGAEKINNKWVFDNAQELLIFGNGTWGIQSSKAIKNLLALGYPSKKILWYRGGIHNWLQLGLTTVNIDE